jgi:hypothetical protein
MTPGWLPCHVPTPYPVLTVEEGHMTTGAWRKGIDRITLLAAAVVVGVLGLAEPAAAQASVQPPAVDPYTLTTDRVVATLAAVAGLIAAVIGGLALARSSGRMGAGNGRRGAIVAMVMGPIAAVIGGLVVATADGGLGTGNGIAGGIVAVIVGVMGIALGGLALARDRRTARSSA